MLTTRVLDASAIEVEGWEDAILALDRETMSPILREAGLPFPEEKRRKGLRDPSTVLILLLDDGALAGYVDFRRDWEDRRDMYLSSIQLRPRYRGGRAFAVLLAECTAALRSHAFTRLRTHVQTNNRAAAALYRKLGFRPSGRPKGRTALYTLDRRELLESERLARLAAARRTAS